MGTTLKRFARPRKAESSQPKTLQRLQNQQSAAAQAVITAVSPSSNLKAQAFFLRLRPGRLRTREVSVNQRQQSLPDSRKVMQQNHRPRVEELTSLLQVWRF
jgi:hypothetical protein